MTTDSQTQPSRQTIVVADLKCYMCGSVAGSIERPQAPAQLRAVPGPVVLHRPGQAAPLVLDDWRRVRCDRCGGAMFLDETDVIVRRIEQYNWTDERPRRGRPSKQLVEQRRRERELYESQAA